jgi:hypothetical protein
MKQAMLTAALLAATAAAQPLEPVPDLAGLTLDSRGEPLRKVTVLLTPTGTDPHGGMRPPYSTESDVKGKFEFYAVPPGRYTLSADKAGYLQTTLGAALPDARGHVLQVGGGQVSGIVLRLTEQCSLTGKVSGDQGELPPYTIVQLMRRGFRDGRSQLVQVARTGANPLGEFSFNKLPAGRYYLLATPQAGSMLSGADASSGYGITYYPSALDGDTAEPVVLSPGRPSRSLTLQLRRTRLVQVRGRVTGASAAQVQVALAALSPGEGPFALNTAASKDGFFELSKVTPGSYTLVATQASPPLIGRRAIDVRTGDLDNLVLPLSPPAELAGLIVTEGLDGTQKFQVELTPTDGYNIAPSKAAVAASGAFIMTGIGPGKYRLRVMGVPEAAYVKAVIRGDHDVLESGLDLASGGAGPPVRIVVSGHAAEIVGSVDGEATVTLIPFPPRTEQPWLYQIVATGADGRFRILGVAPGRYRLFAWERIETDAHYDPELAQQHAERAIELEVAEKERREAELHRIAASQPTR